MSGKSGNRGYTPQRRRLLAVFLVFSAGIIGGGYAYYLRYSAAAVQEKSDLIAVIGESKAQDISDWRAERKAHLVSMARSPVMRIYLRRFLASPGDKQLRGLIQERLASFVLYSGFSSAYFTGPDGKVLAWGGEKERTLNPGAAALLRRAADPRAAVMSDLVPDRKGRPAIYLAVLAARSGAGKLYLTVKLDPYVYLYPLIEKWPTSSPSAETLLVRRDGGDVLFLNELRHRAGTALKLRMPLSEKELPSAAALRGFTGVMRGRDYRGVPVLAYIAPVNGTSWYIVSKIDLSEAFGQLHRSAALLLALVLALLVAGGAVTYSIIKRREAEYVSTLAVAEARFTRLYQQMLDSYVYVDMAGRIVECNAAFERLTGYTLRELKKLAYMDFTPGKWHAAEKRIVEEEIIAKGTSGIYEKEYLRKDGSVVPVELLTVLDRDSEGRPAGMWALIRDLTGRKKAEKALAESEEQFRLMFEEHRAVMLLVDPLSGAIVRANRAAAEFYGYPPEKMVSMRVWDINSLTEEENLRIQGRILSGEGNFFVSRQRLASGELRTVEVRSSSIPVGGRKLNFEIISDITERELAEEKLRSSESALKEAQRLAKLGNWSFDPVTGAGDWSDEVAVIHDLPPGAPITARRGMMYYVPESRRLIEKAVKEAVEQARPYDLELELITEKGARKWVHTTGQCELRGGRVARVYGTFQDITERKKTELALAKAVGELREKNKELEDFMYVASHDLRGPMINIQGFSQNLKKYCAEISSAVEGGNVKTAGGPLGARVPEALDFLLSSAARMDSLINALLKVSRIGRGELRKEHVDMNGLVKGLLDSVNYQLMETGAAVSAGELPPCAGDKDQLLQVFGNLLDNAIKYRSPERALRVEITGARLEDGSAEYRVADNGIGITEEEAAGRIWTLFYRADPKGPVSGDGIGLTAAKRIVEKHGGSIAAERNGSGGATIVVRLPDWRDS